MVTVGISLAVSVKPTSVASQASSVRLALVNVPEDVLRSLFPDFRKQAGRSVEIVYTGNDPFSGPSSRRRSQEASKRFLSLAHALKASMFRFRIRAKVAKTSAFRCGC